MADEADFASSATDAWLQQAIQASRTSGPKLKPIGACHFCEREFDEAEDGKNFAELLFCDVSCRDDYDKYNKPRR